MQSTISLSDPRETTKLQSRKDGHKTQMKLVHADSLSTMALSENIASGGDTFRLLTLNTWGLKYISKFRKERLTAIADRLARSETSSSASTSALPSAATASVAAAAGSSPSSSPLDVDDYDIVALQEIWSKEDWDYLDRVCAAKYPFRRWFSSGILSGPGLAVLSKFPIKKTFLYRFPVNGRPSAFFRGDWYVGKSVAVTILVLSDDTTVALLNSHMHAPYARSGDASYEAHRSCQAWEISIIVDELRAAGHAVILVGDLNSRPGSLPYRILETDAGLSDSWELLNGKTDLELVKTMDPWEQIIRAATTCDSILNTWRADRRPDEACRLDYALVDANVLEPVQAGVRFTEKIPNVGSYSDHFAYSVTFRFKLEKGSNDSDATKSVLPTASTTPDDKLLQVYFDLKDLVSDYMETTLVWQRKWRMWHFVVSFAVTLAFLPVITVVSYRAPWSSILFYFFGCIIFVTGVVNGMISFLFGRYELRNMREVVLEVDDRLNYVKAFGPK